LIDLESKIAQNTGSGRPSVRERSSSTASDINLDQETPPNTHIEKYRNENVPEPQINSDQTISEIEPLANTEIDTEDNNSNGIINSNNNDDDDVDDDKASSSSSFKSSYRISIFNQKPPTTTEGSLLAEILTATAENIS